MWGAVGFGHAHHFGDDQQGQGHCKVTHQVYIALLLRLIQQMVSSGDYQGAPLFHGLGVKKRWTILRMSRWAGRSCWMNIIPWYSHAIR